jgi:hypothetical protein
MLETNSKTEGLGNNNQSINNVIKLRRSKHPISKDASRMVLINVSLA